MKELITIGPGRSADADVLAAMSRDLIETGLSWIWRAEPIEAMMKRLHCSVLVARDPETILGFGAMEYRPQHAHLVLLAVHPDHRRRGIADRLLKALEYRARQKALDYIVLEVRAGNENAIGFYEHRGYAIGDIEPGYYQGQEHALRMIKVLAPNERYPCASFIWIPTEDFKPG